MRASGNASLLAPLLLCSCTTLSGWVDRPPAEPHRAIVEIHAQWQGGEMPAGSLHEMRRALSVLGEEDASVGAGLRSLPDLCRLALDNPSGLVRADALRAAWKLGRQLPPEPWRLDELAVGDFNARARRLDELLGAGPAAASADPEALELARWLSEYRFAPDHAVDGVSLAAAVLSQWVVSDGALRAAFGAGLEGSLRHAVVLATLAASVDEASIVREEALRWSEELPAAVAVPMLATSLARETDSLLLLAGLDGLAHFAPGLSPVELETAVASLPLEPDPAVQRRLEEVLRTAAP